MRDPMAIQTRSIRSVGPVEGSDCFAVVFDALVGAPATITLTLDPTDSGIVTFDGLVPPFRLE